MSREKQIEEMAKIICTPTANKGNCDKCGFKRHCSKFDDATDLYNAGYRKASDLAEEIFAEIEEKFSRLTPIHLRIFPIGTLERIFGTIAELKKKYTEEGNESKRLF